MTITRPAMHMSPTSQNNNNNNNNKQVEEMTFERKFVVTFMLSFNGQFLE
jgi:hypothetical protein